MKNTNFVIHESYDVDYQPPAQLAFELAKSSDVLLVNRPLSLRSLCKPKHDEQIECTTKIRRFRSPQFPIAYGLGLLNRPINSYLWAKGIEKRISDERARRYVIFDRPYHYANCKPTWDAFWIYYAHCDYTVDIIGRHNPQLAAQERKMLQRVDLALAASEDLAERFRRDGARRVEVFPCAYNDDLFDGHRSYPEPEALKGLPHPRLLFSGHITGRIDFEGLLRTMRERPDWRLVLIGQISAGLADELERSGRERDLFDQLCALENVHYCGRVSLAEVPPYIAACDVGLIPYCLSDFTRTSSPIKAFEYLGMGKAVVSTNIPAAIREDLEIIVSDEGDYGAAIEQALAGAVDAAQINARIASVAKDTVEARAKQLVGFL